MNKNKLLEKYSISRLHKSVFLMSGCLLLSGCFATKTHSPSHKAKPKNGEIALLLPLSGKSSPVASQLKNAVMLAFENESGEMPPNLKVFDTGSMSAQSAAQMAVTEKAALVLGPLTAEETQKVSTTLSTTAIPQISFTSDSREAREGVWVSGLTARQQVSRLVEGLKAENKHQIAALLPFNDFGKSFGEALTQVCQENEFPIPQIMYHDGSAEKIAQNLQILAKTQQRRDNFEKARTASPDAVLEAPPFQALLLVDTGVNLRNIITYLPDSDIHSSEVQIMGPALWRAFDGKLASIQGAWYAAPNDENREEYVKNYEQKFHQRPLMITDFAYDIANSIKKLEETEKLSAKKLLKPEGFTGIGGHFVFEGKGRISRDLSLYQILPSGGAKIVQPNDSALQTAPAIQPVTEVKAPVTPPKPIENQQTLTPQAPAGEKGVAQ